MTVKAAQHPERMLDEVNAVPAETAVILIGSQIRLRRGLGPLPQQRGQRTELFAARVLRPLFVTSSPLPAPPRAYQHRAHLRPALHLRFGLHHTLFAAMRTRDCFTLNHFLQNLNRFESFCHTERHFVPFFSDPAVPFSVLSLKYPPGAGIQWRPLPFGTPPAG